MTVKIQIRRGSSLQWANSTKILAQGEIGLDTTLNKIKIGNNTNLWPALSFINFLSGEITALAQSSLDTALIASTGLTKNYNNTANTTTLAVDNTIANKSYVDAAVSTLGGTSAVTYVPLSLLGNPDGVAELDENSFVPDSQISAAIARDAELSLAISTEVTNRNSAISTAIANLIDSSPAALDTLNEIAAAINDDASYAATITTGLATKAPLSSPTFTGTVSGITKSMVGLGDVNNTTDALKPISTATQTALDLKLNTSGFTYSSITIPVYSTAEDLPSATDNHGRWAHVHGEGVMYYAHGGSWYRALSQTDLYVSTNSQSEGYTLQTSDLGKMIEMSGGGTLTIADSSSFPVGFSLEVLQTSASQVTIAGITTTGTSFTPNASPGLKLRAQWSSATLFKRALNSWVVLGDLSA